MLRSSLLAEIFAIEHGFQNCMEPVPKDLVGVHQIHSDRIIKLPLPVGEQHPKADGLFTTGRELIGVQTADCLPVLLTDSKGQAIAAVHAGWRGLLQGILPLAVSCFHDAGFESSHLLAAIGPGIGPCCYEVSREVIQNFQDRWGFLWTPETCPWIEENKGASRLRPPAASNERGAHTRGSNLWINLPTIARLQLLDAGLGPELVENTGQCTYCGSEQIASFRRATHEGQCSTGRQWSWIRRRA